MTASHSSTQQSVVVVRRWQGIATNWSVHNFTVSGSVGKCSSGSSPQQPFQDVHAPIGLDHPLGAGVSHAGEGTWGETAKEKRNAAQIYHSFPGTSSQEITASARLCECVCVIFKVLASLVFYFHL
ncbi:hypothetical protein E2C01_080177 [Portunus trituberculatus]|uniref:Uncharacterized protein n=1 Tax=Portunus trituberculatus TaxID=210409 RepID=A0A5B7ISG8_PORTR|nr:hypothetical protein [Portunus trituberculatus]